MAEFSPWLKPGKNALYLLLGQIYKPEMTSMSPMDIMSIAFYVILFVLAFMIARIIMKIMRGY